MLICQCSACWLYGPVVSCSVHAQMNRALIFLTTDAFSHLKLSKSLWLGNGHVELISMVFPKQAVALVYYAVGPTNKCIVLHFCVLQNYALSSRPQLTLSMAAVRNRQKEFSCIYTNPIIWCTLPIRSLEHALGGCFALTLFIPNQLESGDLNPIQTMFSSLLFSSFFSESSGFLVYT